MAVNEALTAADISARLKPFFEKHDIERAVLFGSYARGTQTRKSDIDLIVVMNTDKRFFDRYEELADIGNFIEGRHIDLLVYTPQELIDIGHRRFIRDALDEGIQVYGN